MCGVCAYVYCRTTQVENSSYHAEDINLLAAVLKVLMIVVLGWGAGILGVVNYRQVPMTGNTGQRDSNKLSNVECALDV